MKANSTGRGDQHETFANLDVNQWSRMELKQPIIVGLKVNPVKKERAKQLRHEMALEAKLL